MLTKEILEGKNILLRADLDLPLKNGRVENNYRLLTLLPTLKMCLDYGRRTCVIGHLGRPKGPDSSLSLAPVREELKGLINQEISFITSGFSPGEGWTGENSLTLLENLRFDSREEMLDREFARILSGGADLYIYEAFASHNPSTSLNLIPEILPTYTGLQFDKEIEALSKVLQSPSRPTLLIASGAKMDKLEVIHKMSDKFDQVLLGGKFALPEHLTPDGLDLNDSAISHFLTQIQIAGTIVLNGPLGYYEDGIHNKATKAIFEALKTSRAFTVLGGGDTLAAIPHLGLSYTDYGFVSTGGGAMLDYLADGTHPLLQILQNKRA